MKFSSELIDKYKEFKGYTQDKQVVADLDNCNKGNLSQIRKGLRHLTPNQCIFICKEMGIDFKPELIQLAIERSKTKEESKAWQEVAKKINAACVAGLLLLTASFTQIQGAHSRIRHSL
ncbi:MULTISPECIES: DUF3693 domain-containing protein [unclassified Pseudoalteromonas]|uniref:DUF3693 domain-containing protein n=1 Tax=unclassified Pseudoalteromonas TaxID=194690 RepID=UPI0025B28F19|nr:MULTISPECIES: DUF3693 domain-containing protein [unclassified Pseudoalteromonas]MDN3377950.1 DUF3693 domain-containing protein [Pseudoalteromonas sp. APC 3893]MDN3386145.1 DUF3693 domain-containing protein [Pseudoalteromonas sp. APC 4017]